MAQFLLPDVPEDMVAALEKRAKAHGRSAEAELRAILEDAIKPKPGDFWSKAEAWQKKFAEEGRQFDDSAELIRRDRDER